MKTPRQPSIRDLGIATRVAKDAEQTAADKLARRDAMALSLANRGATYAELAKAMGITVDGVTYVLRKLRRAAQAKPTE